MNDTHDAFDLHTARNGVGHGLPSDQSGAPGTSLQLVPSVTAREARWANALQCEALVDVVTKEGEVFTLRGRTGAEWRWVRDGLELEAGHALAFDDGTQRPTVHRAQLDAQYALLEWKNLDNEENRPTEPAT